MHMGSRAGTLLNIRVKHCLQRRFFEVLGDRGRQTHGHQSEALPPERVSRYLGTGAGKVMHIREKLSARECSRYL